MPFHTKRRLKYNYNTYGYLKSIFSIFCNYFKYWFEISLKNEEEFWNIFLSQRYDKIVFQLNKSSKKDLTMKHIVLKHHSNTIVLFHKQEAKNNKTKFIYDSFENHLHTIELNLGRREQINIVSVIVQGQIQLKI